jgi:hypothetical protein
MHKRMNFNHIAATLATLSTASFVAGDLAAASASDLVSACEVTHAVALGEGDGGDAEKDKGKDKEKDKDRGKGEGDEGTGDKNKKKKGKKEGSCGGHGGCGAGSCG